jgi:hypothetical protein
MMYTAATCQRHEYEVSQSTSIYHGEVRQVDTSNGTTRYPHRLLLAKPYAHTADHDTQDRPTRNTLPLPLPHTRTPRLSLLPLPPTHSLIPPTHLQSHLTMAPLRREILAAPTLRTTPLPTPLPLQPPTTQRSPGNLIPRHYYQFAVRSPPVLEHKAVPG